MSKPWTAISYNWSAGRTMKIVFHGANDPKIAKQEFENQYPKEDLVALIPGSHDHATTYPLNNFKGAIENISGDDV